MTAVFISCHGIVWSVKKIQKIKNLGRKKKKKRKLTLLLKCVVCDSKKLRFIKKQEASEFLSNLGLKTSLS